MPTACRSKFISEFGSQSYPTFATYAEATAPEDWQVDNFMTGFRNRRWVTKQLAVHLGPTQMHGLAKMLGWTEDRETCCLQELVTGCFSKLNLLSHQWCQQIEAGQP